MDNLKAVIEEAKDSAKLMRGMGRNAIAVRFDRIAERLLALELESAKPAVENAWRVWLDKDGHISSHRPYLPTSPIEWFEVQKTTVNPEKKL